MYFVSLICEQESCQFQPSFYESPDFENCFIAENCSTAYTMEPSSAERDSLLARNSFFVPDTENSSKWMGRNGDVWHHGATLSVTRDRYLTTHTD